MSKRAVTPINNLIDQGSSGTVENFDQEVHSLPVCEEIVNEIWQDVAEKQYIKDLLRRRIKPYVIKNAISVCLETIPPQELNGDYSTLIDSLKETMSKQQDHFREVQYNTRSIYPVREEDCSEVRIELGAGGETSSFVGDMSKGRGPPMNIDMLDISLEPSSVSGGRGYDTRSPGISAQSQYTSKKQPAALAQIRGRKSKIIQQGIKDNTPMLSGHKSLKHDSDSQTLKSTGRPGKNLDKRSEQRVKTPSSDGSETHPKMNKQYPLRWANPKQTAQQLMQSLFVQKMREQLIADRKREAFEAQFKTKESSQEKPASSKKEQRSHEKIKKLKDIGGPLMLAKVSSKAECTQSAQERWADLQYQQVQKQALRQGRQPTMTKQDFVNMKMAEKRGTGGGSQLSMRNDDSAQSLANVNPLKNANYKEHVKFVPPVEQVPPGVIFKEFERISKSKNSGGAMANKLGAGIMPFVEKRMLKGGDYTFKQHMPEGFNRESFLSQQTQDQSVFTTGERMTLTEYSKVAGRSTLGVSSYNEDNSMIYSGNKQSTRFLSTLSNPNNDPMIREEICTPDSNNRRVSVLSNASKYTKNSIQARSKISQYQPLQKIKLNPQLRNSAAFCSSRARDVKDYLEKELYNSIEVTKKPHHALSGSKLENIQNSFDYSIQKGSQFSTMNVNGRPTGVKMPPVSYKPASLAYGGNRYARGALSELGNSVSKVKLDKITLSPDMPKQSDTMAPQSPGRRIPQSKQGKALSTFAQKKAIRTRIGPYEKANQ